MEAPFQSSSPRVNRAFDNLNTFNHLKGKDSVINFANLNATPAIVEEDNTKSNVGRFAATFFSFGLYSKFRNENLAQSLQVQKTLELNYNALKSMSIQTTDALTPQQRIQRETVLKTFDTIIFETRTTFFPPPFLARFYYWVLGVHNQTFYERLRIAVTQQGANQLQALEDASSSVVEREKKLTLALTGAVSPPLAIAYSGNQLSSASASSDGRVAAPLTDLQQRYKDLVIHSIIAKENADAQACQCRSRSEFGERRRMINAAQDVVIAKNIRTVVPGWERIDNQFAGTAANLGYIEGPQSAAAIRAYYTLLTRNPDRAASLRREAESRMMALVEETAHDFMLELLGSISRSETPTFILDIVKQLNLLDENDQLVEFKDSPFEDFKGIKDFIIQARRFGFQLVASRVNDKLNSKYPSGLNEEQVILYRYQAVMLGLRSFGIMTLTDRLFQKLGFGSLIELVAEACGEKLEGMSAQENQYELALDTYVQSLESEQRVNRDIMSYLSQVPGAQPGELEHQYSVKLAEADRELARPRTVQRVQGSIFSIFSLKLADFRLPVLNINDLGFFHTEIDPQVSNAASSFMRQFYSDFVNFLYKCPMRLLNGEENLRIQYLLEQSKQQRYITKS